MTNCNFDYGVCCDEVCRDGGCCTDLDCASGTCDYNYTLGGYYCTQAPGFDLTLPLIIVIIIVAGVGAWFFLKKRKGGEGEELEEGVEELEEEFY